MSWKQIFKELKLTRHRKRLSSSSSSSRKDQRKEAWYTRSVRKLTCGGDDCGLSKEVPHEVLSTQREASGRVKKSRLGRVREVALCVHQPLKASWRKMAFPQSWRWVPLGARLGCPLVGKRGNDGSPGASPRHLWSQSGTRESLSAGLNPRAQSFDL